MKRKNDPSHRCLAERQRRVERLVKNLGVSTVGLTVEYDASIKYGSCRSVIRINPNLPDDEFDRVFAHEFLHALGVAHNEQSRLVHYSSNSFKNDTLSKAVLTLMKRRA